MALYLSCILIYFLQNFAGTVVKHKRGKLLADLAQPGDEVMVAKGGQGGVSIYLARRDSCFMYLKLGDIGLKCLHIS